MELLEGSFTPQDEKPEEPPQKDKPHVRIRCSVFFDGTLNNRTNTESRETPGSTIYKANKVEAKDNSYENDLTNVAKMEKYIDKSNDSDSYHTLSVYVEGPGTEDDEADATMGYAFGTMETGVKAKVAKGISDTVEEILGVLRQRPHIVDELVFDVFGFSRGAAGARFFIHEALNETPEYVAVPHAGVITIPANPIFKQLENDGHEITPDKVEFRFVGIYDTVASYGVPYWDDGTKLLKLDSLAHSAVKHVIHLVAADEHRANFPITKIQSAGSKGKEIYLPGVHSDIGGSYLASSNEGNSREDGLTINRSYSESTLEADRQQLINEGWYTPDEIFIEDRSFVAKYLIPVAHIVPSKPAQNKLKVFRQNIGHDYDKIPLNLMAGFSEERGVKLTSYFKVNEKIPSALTSQSDELKAYAHGGNWKVSDWFHKTNLKWLNDLRHAYCHFSAHYTLAKRVIAPNKPNFENSLRERGTHEG